MIIVCGPGKARAALHISGEKDDTTPNVVLRGAVAAYKSQEGNGVFNPGGATDAVYNAKKKSGVYDPGGAQDVRYNPSRKAISTPDQPSGKVFLV